MDEKFKPVSNPEAARIARELARSGAAGTHKDRRDRRARTRLADRKRSIEDQRNDG